MKNALRFLLIITILFGWCHLAACGSSSAEPDAGQCTGPACYLPGPRTAAGQLAPQGGTITGATTGGGLLVTSGKLGMLTTCAGGQVLVWGGASWACGAGGITNAAGANVIPKSNGTNLVASTGTAVIGATGTDILTINSTTSILDSVTGVTANNTSLLTIDDTGETIDTTSGVKTHYGLVINAAATRVIGDASSATNVALKLNAGGAQSNYALQVPTGDIDLNSTSGTFTEHQNATFGGNISMSTSGATLTLTGTTSSVSAGNLTASNSIACTGLCQTSVGETFVSTSSVTVLADQTAWSPTNLSQVDTVIITGTGSANRTIRGIDASGASLGRVLQITCATGVGNALFFTNQDAAATAANRISTLNTLQTEIECTGGSISFIYVTGSGWVQRGTSSQYFSGLYDNGTLDVIGSTVLHGTAKVGGLLTLENNISFDDQTNASSTMDINGVGYLGGTTQFRSINFKNGKGSTLMTLDATTSTLNLSGANLTVGGNFTVNSGSIVTIGSATTFLSTAPLTIGELYYTIQADVTTSGLDNNVALSAGTSMLTFNPTAGDVQLTGITASTNGRRLKIRNLNLSHNVQMYDTNGNSSASNQLSLPIAATGFAYLTGNEEADCVYLTSDSKWHCYLTWDWQSPTSIVGTADISAVSTITSGTTLTAGTNLVVNGNSTIGTTATALATFSNGPSGINTYAGTHLEWTDEYLNASAFANGSPVGSSYTLQVSGGATAAGASDTTGVTQRPGILELSTGSTATALVAVATSPNAVNFGDGSWTWEHTVAFPTLSTGTQEYIFEAGFFDGGVSTLNQVDGCYFVYDRGRSLTAPVGGSGAVGTAANNWECWCASNSTRTGYQMNGVQVSDETFTTVNKTVAAVTYPNTNVYRLKLVMTGTTRAEFFINGTKSCDINTNLPSGSARLTGAGWVIGKTVGTTASTVDTDQTRLAADLTSARSP